MSDPTERHKSEPHPISSHRTPEEIAEDEAGLIGHATPRYVKPGPDDGRENKDVKGLEPKQEARPR